MTDVNIAQKAPYKIRVEKGKLYSWCACGYSSTQPFCDGSHREKAPGIKSIKYLADADAEIRFCGCKHSKNGVLCDGSHNNLSVIPPVVK